MPTFKENPNAKSAFYLKSGNTTPFKQMGSSPLKQTPKDFNMTGGSGSGTPGLSETKIGKKAASIKKYGTDAINKEITRVAKGGKVKADLIKEAARKSTTTVAKKSILSRILTGLGGKALSTAGAYFSSMSTATATQPGTGTHGGTKVKSIHDMINNE